MDVIDRLFYLGTFLICKTRLVDYSTTKECDRLPDPQSQVQVQRTTRVGLYQYDTRSGVWGAHPRHTTFLAHDNRARPRAQTPVDVKHGADL
jgi:hypothetical protein